MYLRGGPVQPIKRMISFHFVISFHIYTDRSGSILKIIIIIFMINSGGITGCRPFSTQHSHCMWRKMKISALSVIMMNTASGLRQHFLTSKQERERECVHTYLCTGMCKCIFIVLQTLQIIPPTKSIYDKIFLTF